MSVTKIVFTGGPCAGKTIIINMIKEYLKEKGYRVICVPETATELINSELKDISIVFQTNILKLQYFKEKLFESNTINDSKTIILYDRGILDNKAYLNSYKEFDYIMKYIPLSEINALDKYDLVLDLLSLATCNEEAYRIHMNSNPARSETLNQARIKDRKTSNAWVGHRNMRLFRSNMSLDEEFNIIKETIDSFLNNENNKNVACENINKTLEEMEEQFDDNNSRLIDVEKIYLKPINNCYYELEKRIYKNSTSYILNIYDNNKYISKKITYQEYIELMLKFEKEEIINYKSLNYVRNSKLYEIKFYNNKTTINYIKEDCKCKKKVLI